MSKSCSSRAEQLNNSAYRPVATNA